MKYVDRNGWGARPFAQPNGAITYARPRRGVKVHYLGVAYPARAHNQCAAYIRSIQNQHMDGNGWTDIGYSFLVCTHGYVYEGRGIRRRNSANGGTELNENHYAVCALVGTSGVVRPTSAQMHGVRDAIDYCRSSGPAGNEILGHRDGRPTACPGEPLYAWVKQGAPRPGGATPSVTTPEDDDMPERTLYGTTDGYRLEVPPNTRRQLTFDRVHETPGGWRTKLAEPSILFGPCFYSATVAIRAEGLTKGQEVQLQLAHYRRTADDKGWERSGGMPISSPVHDGGSLHAIHTWQSHITGNRRGRVRVEIQHFGDNPITVTYARAESFYWPGGS